MIAKPVSRILQTFLHTCYYPQERLFTWHLQGVLDDALADDLVGMVESEELLQGSPFNRYADLSLLSAIHLKVGHVFQIAERRRVVFQPVKSAIFAQTAVGLGIARLYEALMREAMIDVRTFHERDTAAEWLGVPVKLLLPDCRGLRSIRSAPGRRF